MNSIVRYVYSGLLVDARQKQRITQAKAAERCGVSTRQYQKFEGGKALPRLDRAIHIAVVMEFSLDELVRQVRKAKEPAPAGV